MGVPADRSFGKAPAKAAGCFRGCCFGCYHAVPRQPIDPVDKGCSLTHDS